MLTIALMGGLGNQCFQWMLGRALEHRGRDVEYNPRLLEESRERRYLLGDLGVELKLNRNKFENVIPEGTMAYHPEIFDVPDGSTLVGYWQHFDYVKGIEETIRGEIFEHIILSPTSQRIGHEIATSESCMIHVRRSDNLRPTSHAYHGLTSAADSPYYRKAIDLVRKKVPNVQFYVFSDDPQWITENVNEADMIPVIHNRPSFIEDETTHELDKTTSGREVEDLFLMSLCRHAIIANSSFSCLGVWLNPLESWEMKRVVVRPEPWFQTKEVDGEEICPKQWTRIAVR